MSFETAIPERYAKPWSPTEAVPPKFFRPAAATPSRRPLVNPPLVNQIIAEVRAALARDARTASLERALERTATLAEEGGEAFPASPRQIYLADLRQGRAPSWYAAEALALAADLPTVAARHNRELLARELERRKREVAGEICAGSVLLRGLAPEDRDRVLDALGVGFGRNGAAPREEPPEPAPAARYRIVVAPLRRGEGPKPDPEVLSLFEEDQADFESNGDARRGGRRRAEAILRGMLAPGVRADRVFGSSGNGSGPESVRGRRPRVGGVPLAVTKSMRAGGSGAWIMEEDWVTPLDAAWE